MASYTENLNLLKKDPTADGSDTFNIKTMLNDNWDKLDASKAETDASMANKATIEQGFWSADSAGQGQSILLYPPKELPEDKRYPIKIRTFFDQRGASSLQFFLADNNARGCFLPMTGMGVQAGTQIATATPPDEYDLPLASGFSVAVTSRYFKTQDGVVTVYFCVKKTDGSVFADWDVIATLPHGFRPEIALQIGAVLGAESTALRASSGLIVNAEGDIGFQTIPDKTYAYCVAGVISFVAGN